MYCLHAICVEHPQNMALYGITCRNQKKSADRVMVSTLYIIDIYSFPIPCSTPFFFQYEVSFFPTNCIMLTGILKRKPAICSGDSGTFGYSTSISYFKHHINSSLLYCFYLNNHIECNIAMFSILHFHNIAVYLFKKALSSDASDSIICVKCT